MKGSFMCNRKRVGDRTKPYETPRFIGLGVKQCPSIIPEILIGPKGN